MNISIVDGGSGGPDQGGYDGKPGLDRAWLMLDRDARYAAVEDLAPDTLFELVEPDSPTRYNLLMQEGSRQLLKRELDARVDELFRTVVHSLPYLPTHGALRASHDTVYMSWRPSR